MSRKIVAIIEVDEEQAIKEDIDTGEYFEREFGWVEQSGIGLENWFISDCDDTVEYGRYIDYLIEWCFEHSQDIGENMSPLKYEEWQLRNFDNVIDDGRNIKMINMTGCGVDENWTLDDCENNCPKYYSCYAVALANDVLKEYEESRSEE